MEPHDDDISWFRAILAGMVVLIVGLGVTVLGTNKIVLGVTGLSRDNVGYLASAFFLISVAAAAWLLRRLQSRGVI